MAYMYQEKKKELEPAIKAICKRHGVKGTLSIRHHSSLVLTISEGQIDFGEDPYVNVYHFREYFTQNDAAHDFLKEVIQAMNVGNWDRSDSQVDYFDVGWYIDVKIGRWDRPYKLMEKA